MNKSPVIVALDKHSLSDALRLADSLDANLCRLKVGKELFTICGTQIISELHKRQFDVFLDLKFHDIPNTSAQAVLAAADLGVWMTNVHASIGSKAMQLCMERLAGYDTLLIAVTVLTSMTDDDLMALGCGRTVSEQVMYLANLSYEAGLNGVVCSAHEAHALKKRFGADFQLITPGIRLESDSQDDQQRICTPKQALINGSDYLVIGRPINMADEPNQKLAQIIQACQSLSP